MRLEQKSHQGHRVSLAHLLAVPSTEAAAKGKKIANQSNILESISMPKYVRGGKSLKKLMLIARKVGDPARWKLARHLHTSYSNNIGSATRNDIGLRRSWFYGFQHAQTNPNPNPDPFPLILTLNLKQKVL